MRRPAVGHAFVTAMSGERLRTQRQSLGLTQRQLAQLLDVSGQCISDWETGRKTPAHPAMLRLAMDRLAAPCLCTTSECLVRE